MTIDGVIEHDEPPEVEILADRLAARFPGVPDDSVRQVAGAAWAEVANIPAPGIAAGLAENVASESLKGYPVSPSADGGAG